MTDPTDEAPLAEPRKKTGRVVGVIAVVAIVLVVAVGGLLWITSSDAPPPPSLEAARQGAGQDNTGTRTGTDGTTPDDDKTSAVDGTWTLQPGEGDVAFENATGTFVGFRVSEDTTIRTQDAVGRTGAVTGEIVIADGVVEEAEFTADLTTIKTDQELRNERVQESLQTDTFPDATFNLTEPIELDEGALTGEQITVEAAGEIEIHGVTQEITITLEAQLDADTVIVAGSAPITFTDFDIEVPTAPVIVSIAETGALEIQLLFTKD